MRKLLFLAILVGLLAGCSDISDLSFTGSTDEWTGKYTAIVDKGTNSEDGQYSFVYEKGYSDVEIKDLEININDGENILRQDSYTGRVIIFPTSCNSCLTTEETDTIKVDIKWDGKETSFLLVPDR